MAKRNYYSKIWGPVPPGPNIEPPLVKTRLESKLDDFEASAKNITRSLERHDRHNGLLPAPTCYRLATGKLV